MLCNCSYTVGGIKPNCVILLTQGRRSDPTPGANRGSVYDGSLKRGSVMICTFPELSASCDSVNGSPLNEPADFWVQAPY